MGAAPTELQTSTPPRRSPVARAAFFLLALVAVGSLGLAWRIETARRASDEARKRAESSEKEMREQLRRALLETSRSAGGSTLAGHRQLALSAAEQAAKISPTTEARNAVIAALALPDLALQRRWNAQAMKDGLLGLAIDADRYVVEKELGRLEIRRLGDDSPVAELRGTTSKLRVRPILSDDGAWVSARNNANELLVWHESKHEPLWKLAPRPGPPTEVSEVGFQPDAFSSDGDLLASALPGGAISIHRTDTGAEIGRVAGQGDLTHVAFSPDGLFLAAARSVRAANGTPQEFLRIIEGAKFTVLREVKLESGFRTLSWSQRSDKLMLAGGGRLDVFRAADLKRCASITDPASTAAWFGPASNLSLSLAPHTGITAWETLTARPLLHAPMRDAQGASVGQHSAIIVTALADHTMATHRLQMPEVVASVCLDDADTRTEIARQGMSLDYSPDGKWIVTSLRGRVLLRKSDNGKVVASIPVGKTPSPVTVAFSTFSDRFYAASRDAGLFRIGFKASDSGKLTVAAPEPLDPESDFVICDVSDDGRRVLLVSPPKNEVKIVELGPPQNVIRWKHNAPAQGIFLNGGRSALVNGSNHDGSALLAVRNSSTGDVEMPLPFADGTALRVSPDRRTVWISSGPNKAVVQRFGQWSAGFTLPEEVQSPDARVAFAFSSRLLAASEQSHVRLIDSESGQTIAHLPPFLPGSQLRGVEFSPIDSHLALWWDNGTLTLWNLNKLRQELGQRNLDW